MKTIIFDLGGVIADLKTKEAFRAFAEKGVPIPEELYTATGPLNGVPSDIPMLSMIHRMDVGDITGNEFLETIQKQCRPGTTYDELLHAYNDLIEVPRHRLEMLRELRKTHQVFLLSNIGDLHWEKFRDVCAEAGVPVEECFDRLYLSYQLRMAKPDARIFEHVISDSGINPAEALYIDDFIDNIRAGEAAGLQTFHIAGNTLDERLPQILEAAGIRHSRQEKLEAFGRLIDVLDNLRMKCPWDRKQTNESLRPHTIEEAYELCDALMKNDTKEICKELGDVLEHVIFYSIIGREKGEFDIADICNKEADKLIFRHPHIYGEQHCDTSDDVSKLWEQVKQKEKDGNKTVLSGVPQSLPSLIKAYRIQDKASNVGFDWEERHQVWDKVHEEIDELRAELERGDKEHSLDELGDFIFATVNAARLYHLNPDTALERTNQKFIRRFNYVEAKAKEMGKDIKDLTLGEMDALWDECKKQE